MLTWSTDHLPPRDRFEHWREVRAKGIFGVTAERDPDYGDVFRGNLTIRPFERAALVELQASPYKVWRGKADIARSPSDSFCLYQQIDGRGWFEAERGREFVTPRGTLATSHSDLPYSTMPMTPAGYHLRVLKIPNASALTGRAHELVARPLDERVPVTALVQSCFADLVALDEAREPAQAEALVESLTQLALIARGVVEARGEAGAAALRAGRLSASRHIIGRDSDDPILSPALVAAQLGIPVRQLHLLFEPEGASFAQHVTTVRLAQVCRRLEQRPSRPVAEIAFASGFTSLATFHRCFRAAFGMTPNDYRQAIHDGI